MHGLGDVRLTGDADNSTVLCKHLNILVPLKPVIKYPLCSPSGWDSFLMV